MEKQNRYYTFSRYLKERFGCAVYKVSVDAGFDCPNKDGKISTGGCIYCDNKSFSLNSRGRPRGIESQIKEGMASGKRRYGAQKFIVYFQAHTNTYAPLGVLKERYDVVRGLRDIVGISIGTRPDCVDEKTLDLISGYANDYDVWIEYGLQSVHDKTLKLINRGHKYEDFLKAVGLTRERPVKICAHLILGLPGETKEDMMKTASELSRLKIDAVKIHPLHVVKGTKLEEYAAANKYKMLKFDEYVPLVCEFLKVLAPGIVIQRITADCPADLLVGPSWIQDKSAVLDAIDARLTLENAHQGISPA